MTDGDLTRIEAVLGISLPQDYRQLMAPFPIPAFSGNAETELWDDADRLIELNLELRAGIRFVQPWPAHMFALGRDDGGSASAIDLRDPASPIWWADRCHLDRAGYNDGHIDDEMQTFVPWAAECLEELRIYLDENGIDPDDSPAARKVVEEQVGSGGCRFVFALLALGLLAAIAMWGLVFWLRNR